MFHYKGNGSFCFDVVGVLGGGKGGGGGGGGGEGVRFVFAFWFLVCQTEQMFCYLFIISSILRDSVGNYIG